MSRQTESLYFSTMIITVTCTVYAIVSSRCEISKRDQRKDCMFLRHKTVQYLQVTLCIPRPGLPSRNLCIFNNVGNQRTVTLKANEICIIEVWPNVSRKVLTVWPGHLLKMFLNGSKNLLTIQLNR